MNQIWSLARKELRGYFNSAVAFIFLGAFLASVLFTFFWVEKFFARGVADVRPLFEWLPILLIFLVAALTMRLWSEEQRAGTIELLLTLPVPIHRLVLGKFLAGFLLIALALGLTLGLPITVSLMGNIDPGPVVGGYVAALLLAGAYLSIGLCVSAATDNQIVSLVTTTLVCAALYLPGMAAVGGSEGYAVREVLHAIGTGTRFESIARGVIDLRDLAYWGGLIVFGLVLNTTILAAKRWSAGKRTRARRTARVLTTALVGLNMIALSVWLAPLSRARVDLTENGLYQLSDVTETLLASLDEPLLIRGYFSAKSHPLLTPLVPQIRDMLEEYRIEGGDNVRIEFVDPTDDPAVADEALQEYNIASVPLEFADHTGESVVNAYFHILVQYGNQHLVLDWQDLVEIRPGPDVGDVSVHLRNLEYDLTRAIKKVAYGFKSIDLVIDSLPDKAELVLIHTPDTMPEQLVEALPVFEKVAKELQDKSHGKLTFVKETPTINKQTLREIYDKYGVKASMSILAENAYYFHAVVVVGDRKELVVVQGDVTEASVKSAIETAIRRLSPGFVRRVGVYIPPAPPPEPPNPQLPPQMQQQQNKRPPQMFQAMAQRLTKNYELRHAPLSGPIPDDYDVVIVAGPENLDETAQKAIDQFLMRGGAVIVLAGRYRLDTGGQGLNVEKITTGLEAQLKTYGFEVEDKLIMDTKAVKFGVPVVETLPGGRRRQTVKMISYPFFLDVRRSQMAEGHVVTGPLSSVVMQFASPVKFSKVDAGDGAEVTHDVLLSSSPEAWLQINTDVSPDYRLFPDTGFAVPKEIKPEDKGPHPIAIAAVGTFQSHFKPTDASQAPKDGERLLEVSVPDARLVVIGSSSFAADELARQGGADQFESNMQLIENLVDWAIEDVDLLTIRARGSHMRQLELEDDSQHKWEIINYVLIALGLGLVIGISAMRRRNMVAVRVGRSGGAPPSRRGRADDDEDAVGDDEDEGAEEQE